MFGAVMKTTSTAGSSITARQSSDAATNPNEPSASSRRAGTVSAQCTSDGSNVRSSKWVRMRCIERAWACPSQPRPMTPIPICRRPRLERSITVTIAILPA